MITIIGADGEEEAVRIANDTEYRLSSAVFTRDLDQGTRSALRVEAGMTHVNDSPVNDEPNAAFGGVKATELPLQRANNRLYLTASLGLRRGREVPA